VAGTRKTSLAWSALSLLHPFVADFLVSSFDRRPGDPESRLLLAGITRMSGMCVIERFTKDVLGVLGQMRADGSAFTS
jgi:hypothetical protein